MQKLGKIFMLVLVMTMLATFFAACESNEADKSTSQAISTTENKEPEIDPKQASGTIELWVNPAGFQSDDLQTAWVQTAIDEFNMSYPNMKVNITVLPWADSATKKQLVMSTGKGVPDAMYTFPEEMATFAANDQLVPLDDYFAEEMSDLIGVPDSSYNGKLYIAPVLLATYGMVYNADILAKIGWDKNKLPTTLEEYDKFLELSKEKDYQSYIQNNLYDNLSGFSSVLWSKDTDYITLDKGQVEVGKDNVEFKTLYTYLKSWVDKGYTPMDSVTNVGSAPSAAGIGDFYAGKLASIYLSGIQIKDEKLQKAPFDWVIGPALKFDDTAKSVGIDIVGGFMIPKASKNVEATAELLKIMTNKEHGSAFALGTGYMPTRKSAGNVFTGLKGYDQLADIYANYDEVRGVIHPVVSADFNPILQIRQKIMLGKSSVEDGLEEMKDTLQKDLDKVNSSK
ncbi:extracellular solute-binding protein [Paenibacillus solisilvae]|uniref:Extracellular solute-binding protein n=1 Tax=Paenibacillus solisilvae TaxID=2486751 RepID=A0ABW0VQ56_9BACL